LELTLSIVVFFEMETTRKFTLEELGKFDGKEGRPAYVGYKGKVYDVTESSQWMDGDHLGHAAGEDLTEQMEIAPPRRRCHGKSESSWSLS
jgi:predicted heme/steroid binding protein